MMSGSRGAAGPDPFTSLLGIVGDPKGTKERIEQLQKATAANEESLEALAIKRAELDALAIKLDNREADIEKAQGKVDDQIAALDARERVVARNEQDQGDIVRKLAADRSDAAKTLADSQATASELHKALAAREAELNARAADLETKAHALESERAKIAEYEADVTKRAADLDKRIAAMRELVG
jgi:chromosome segregation ATPase